MIKIAVIGNIHTDGLEILIKSNFEIIEISNFSKEHLINNLKDVDAIVLRTLNLNIDILQECKSLKIVARHGVGIDNVDLNYLNKKNIALAITGTANAKTVAEHVMTMFLNLSKSIKTSDHLVRSGQFHKKNTIESYIFYDLII